MSANEITELTRKLVHAITHADWTTYVELCSDDLTAFEPEAEGFLVEGMAFHQHYFDMDKQSPYVNVTTTLSSPHVRMMGPDAAVISYVRLTQKVGADSTSTTTATQETRVWHRLNGKWQHVHFHRS